MAQYFFQSLLKDADNLKRQAGYSTLPALREYFSLKICFIC